jgi:outer membrane protein OmpA-like peptidoglycan-associated protein
VKPEWIRGRFRGVYSAAKSEGQGEGERRLPLEIEYGELADIEPLASAPAAAAEAELRFERVRGVQLHAAPGGPAERARTLFDVRVRDWQLLYPAESRSRIFGTLVGELSARLLPEAIEPEPLVLARAPHPEPRASVATDATPSPVVDGPSRPISSESIPSAPLRAEPVVQRREETTSEQDLERLLWLVVPVLLGVVGLTLALGCGPETAAIWLAPLACAIAIRQTPSRYRVQGVLARRWLGGLCVLAPLFMMLGAFQTQWVAGCRVPIREQLIWLALPVIGAALIRTQVFVWMCALLWTTTLFGWCAGLDGTCTASGDVAPTSVEAALAGAKGAFSSETSAPSARAPRTDADGHWPVSPEARGLEVNAADAGERPREAAPGAPSAESRVPRTDPGRRGGAWIAPSQEGDAPSLSRISLEQANRHPERFFEPGGARSVYVPTDDIFAPNRADFRRDGEITLGRLANLLKLHPERRVVIEVHTDASGDAAARRMLGARRAGAVSAWLVERGHLAASQLAFDILGAERPIVPPDGSYVEQQPNRRLEIRLADDPLDPT